MYVGGHQPRENIYDKTTFKKIDGISIYFSVSLDSNGLFQSLTIPSGMEKYQINLIKGWANQLQVNAGEIRKGNLAFKSQEVKFCMDAI